MRLLWDNKADGPTLSANSAANNYAVSNLLDWQAAKCWRSNSANAEWVMIAAGANNTISATCCGIVQHNWGANGTYLLQGNNTDSWGSPGLNQNLTRVSGVITQAFNNAAYRYWRLLIDDDTNTDGYVKVGYFYIGDYYQFTDAPTRDFPLAYDDSSTKWTSKTGQEFVNEGVINRRYSFQWPFITNTDRLAIEAIYDEIKQSRPMIVIPDENNLTALPPRFMRLAEPPAWNHLIAYNWNLTLSFKEQL